MLSGGRVSVVCLVSLDVFETRWALLWGSYGAFLRGDSSLAVLKEVSYTHFCMSFIFMFCTKRLCVVHHLFGIL